MVRVSNLEILKILRENSRIPTIKIAKMLGVSETAVRKRIKRMEREGIIRRYTIEIDPKKIGFKVNTLIGLDTRPENYIQTLEKLKEMEEVVSLYTSTGDHMLLIECWLKDSEELTKLVKKLGAIEGVTKICPAILLEKIK